MHTFIPKYFLMGLSRWCNGKESTYQYKRCRRQRFSSQVGKILCGRKWQPTLVFLARKFHRQQNLAGYQSMGVTKGQTRLSMHSLFNAVVEIVSVFKNCLFKIFIHDL